MNIRTAEELSDYLSTEIAWRKKELALLRGMIQSKSSSEAAQNALIRSGITVLYAHWEGFIKSAATAYLKFVGKRRFTYEQLSANFIAIGIMKKLNHAQQRNRASDYIEIVEFFLTGLSERCQTLDESAVDTKSNLSSSIFKEIVCVLNLDYTPYATKEKLIDEKLLRFRNNIAHGKFLLTDVDEYDYLNTEIMSLMDIFKTQVDNAAYTKSYLRIHV